MASTEEGRVDEPVQVAALDDDDAPSPLEERGDETSTETGDNVGEMTSHGEVAGLERTVTPSIAGEGSFEQAPEVPKFRKPRQGPEPPLVLSVPVVVPPPRRRRPVEPPS